MGLFTDWFKKVFYGVEADPNSGEKTIVVKSYATSIEQLNVEAFAISTAINMIAGIISKCEFRTFINDEEIFGDEYYLWNIEPNKNQCSSQFLQELIYHLLYEGECLVIENGGQLIIAESFYKEEYALLETQFKQVYRNGFTFNKTFNMSEVLYFKLNNDNVRLLVSDLCRKYSMLINEAADKYEKSGGKKLTLDIDSLERNKPSFKKDFDTLMNERFKTFFDAKNAVLPLFDGWNVTDQNGEQNKKSTNEIADIKSLMDQSLERAAQAFKIPPAILKGDVADIEKITENLLTFGIDPLCDSIKEEIIRKRYGKSFLKGNYLTIDTTCIRHVDVFSMATNIDKLIACRLYNPEEIRRKVGDSKINEDWAKEYVLTKNYDTVMKGGEKSE